MSDVLFDLVDLLARSAVYAAVSSWVRDQPPAVGFVVLLAAGALFVWVRTRRRSRSRSYSR